MMELGIEMIAIWAWAVTLLSVAIVVVAAIFGFYNFKRWWRDRRPVKPFGIKVVRS